MTETLGSKRKVPCQGCPDRYPGCSDHCQKEDFLKWKAEQETIRKNRETYRSPAWMSEAPFERRKWK